jgi:uncharacterized protein YdaU (DUF1376 family)
MGGRIMSKVPMQQWYPDTHIADTANLTLEEQGAYRLLMDHMWIKGGAIRNDDKEIARMLRISVKRWKKLKLALADYLVIELGIISQKRLQRDYQNAINKSKTNAANGKIGGMKTAEKWGMRQANAVANSTDDAGAKRRGGGSSRHISDVVNQLELEPNQNQN